VGYSVSHGCIRMLPKEIEQLFPQVQVGTPVKIVYRPIKIAVTPQGRVFLEANLNIYQWELKAQEYVKDMASYYEISDRIDWSKVPAILRKRDGVAQDITKAPDPPTSATATSSVSPASAEVRLSPLHGKESKLE
jgi:L,D-transpeptidase ErfK/SrfK